MFDDRPHTYFRTIKELYEWAKENNAENLPIYYYYRDYGYDRASNAVIDRDPWDHSRRIELE